MPYVPPPVPPEQLREAIRDLIGILRAYYLAEAGDSGKRRTIARAGELLREVSEMLAGAEVEPGTEAYEKAMRAADAAVNQVLGSMHFNAPLAPVVSVAAGRVMPSRRR